MANEKPRNSTNEMFLCMAKARDVFYRETRAERAWYNGAGIMIVQSKCP